ncbi:hypothetical protein DASC09_019120 [Saccharomycopsis crataegensis]|uniref:Uncharacterized protein n=1 Tax=Saccharomycopsis crataegensis TaxID=43959 RepID=A0AAV5QIF9_9ASCO|nr:hypothetical protein DASC09_019120 [Saccharomycopsis crataegensis]
MVSEPMKISSLLNYDILQTPYWPGTSYNPRESCVRETCPKGREIWKNEKELNPTYNLAYPASENPIPRASNSRLADYCGPLDCSNDNKQEVIKGSKRTVYPIKMEDTTSLPLTESSQSFSSTPTSSCLSYSLVSQSSYEGHESQLLSAKQTNNGEFSLTPKASMMDPLSVSPLSNSEITAINCNLPPIYGAITRSRSTPTLPSSTNSEYQITSSSKSPHSSLKLAKRRHYTPIQPASAIQKRTGSARPQGRPFTSKLDARFFLHDSMESLISGMIRNTDLQMRYYDLVHTSTLDSRCTLGDSYHDIGNGLSLKLLNVKRPLSESRQPQFKKVSFSGSYNIHKREQKLENRVMVDSREPNVHATLCKEFSYPELKFVKIIRNSSSRVLKIETFRSGEADSSRYDEEGDFQRYESPTFPNIEVASNAKYEACSPEWVKKTIAYPRYKSRMKLHLLPNSDCFVVYNDFQMLQWDLTSGNLKQTVLKNKKVIILTGCGNKELDEILGTNFNR